ncbi:two pore channel protein 1 isoform X1 [Parasteatoda tepidariorum]|uniref:two pore channel protein 1 isoform X1 n=1 Tax=Parasteatoda tepidariorum TaxID=114398 RepID=UPI000A2C0A06|nr:two pore calcium channel protein 1 isoform X1 [Parasteatoda tepidariorum]
MSEGSCNQEIIDDRDIYYSFSLQENPYEDGVQLETPSEREAPLTSNFQGSRSCTTSTSQFLDDTPLGYAQFQTIDDPVDNSEQWDMNYHESSIFLEEGENNDKFTFHPRNRDALPAYNLVHNQIFYFCDLVASVALLSLALTEKPAVAGFAVSEWIHATIELVCLSLMCGEIFLKIRWMGNQAFFRHKRSVIKLVVLVIMIVEAFVVAVRQTSHFRVTRALRPVFLIDNHYCKGIRRVIRQIIQSLPPILDMMSLLLFFMLIFAVLGFYIFRSVEEDTYFTSFGNSFVSMFVLLTTANYPDVMMPSYAASKWSCLFFITFIIIHVYFLMNLMLAVVYETFIRIEKDKFRKLLLHRRKACQHAFRLLVTRNSPLQMSFRHFEGLMKYFKPKNSKLDNYLMFKTVDINKTGYLTMNEFLNVFEVSPLKWKPKRQDDLWFVHLKGVPLMFFKGLNKVVTHQTTDFIVNAVVALNGLWQIVEASELFGSQQPKEAYYEECDDVRCDIRQNIYGWVSIGFVTFYTVEVSIKIIGLGIAEYLSSKWNRFDLGVTVLALCGLIAEQFRCPFSYVTILRSLRLLRLFKLKKRYRDVLGTLFIILPRFLSVALVLVILYYFFGIIGMEIMSGYDLVNCCKNTTVEQYYRYDNDSSLDGYYYLNNFNNFLFSQVTLFELMVVNNWFIIMEGYALVVSQWTRLYFMSFYVVTMVVINIVVAFVLESFLFRIQYKRATGDMDKDTLVRVDIGLNEQEIDFCRSKTYLSKAQMKSFARDEISPRIIYRGTRTRTKFSFSLKMHAEEVKEWLKQADTEERTQRELLLSRLQVEHLTDSRRVTLEEEYHIRTLTI